MGEHKRHLCECGSGKHSKACCGRQPRGTRMELEETARRLSRAGQHLEACAVLEQRAALSPHNPMIWNDLGNEYAAAGDLERAVAALKRAHEVDPVYPLALYNLGKYTLDQCTPLQDAGKTQEPRFEPMLAEAIGYFEAALARDDEHAACHYNLAVAYGYAQDLQRAGAHMMEALRLDPELERLVSFR